MSEPYVIDIVIGLLSLGLTVTMGLLAVIFTWLKARIDRNEDKLENKIAELRSEICERLRTLGHEDRDIRTQVSGVYKILAEQIQQVGKSKK